MTRHCEWRDDQGTRTCLHVARWKVQVGTREMDAQLSCGSHLHAVCLAMEGAEGRSPKLTLTYIWPGYKARR